MDSEGNILYATTGLMVRYVSAPRVATERKPVLSGQLILPPNGA